MIFVSLVLVVVVGVVGVVLIVLVSRISFMNLCKYSLACLAWLQIFLPFQISLMIQIVGVFFRVCESSL